jgi:diacylglycerol O-acyltransferase
MQNLLTHLEEEIQRFESIVGVKNPKLKAVS